VELPEGQSERLARAVFEVDIRLDRVLDLTDLTTVAAMGAEPIERWILDLVATQAAASYLLAQIADLQALIVPSVAFLDRPERFNVVAYRDRIDPAVVFTAPVFVREIVLEGTGRA
jgi:hypothetical protein